MTDDEIAAVIGISVEEFNQLLTFAAEIEADLIRRHNLALASYARLGGVINRPVWYEVEKIAQDLAAEASFQRSRWRAILNFRNDLDPTEIRELKVKGN